MGYTKQNFTDGQVLKAEHLNKIEQGIVDLETNGAYITVDSALNGTSTNPVQNKVVQSALAKKQATLVSGTNIKTVNGQSLLGSGDIAVEGGSGDSKVVDLALFIGQSNMAGRGVASEAPVVPEGHGYEFRAITDPTKLYTLTEPFGVKENNSSSGVTESSKTGSMVSAFANAYYKHTDVPIVGVSCSKGGTNIEFWSTGGAPLNDAIARHNSAKTWLESNGYTIRHDFMVWCQGEADAKQDVTDEAYTDAFKAIVEAMMAEGVEACFVVRIGKYDGTEYSHDGMIALQTKICKTYENAILVSTDFADMVEKGLMKDEQHYLQEGYNITGANAGKNTAFYFNNGVEPYMYDGEFDNVYVPYGEVSGTVTIDSALSESSENPVQNKVINTKISSLLSTISSLEDRLLILESGGDYTIYNLTNNLTNVTTSNTVTKVIEGRTYETMLTPSDGMVIESVVVTMGGEDITSTAYVGEGVILIESVSGDIVITATADIDYLIDLDFANYTLNELQSSGQIVLDSTPSVAVVQDEKGYCMDGSYPNGFALPEDVTVPEKWELEVVATHPDFEIVDTNTDAQVTSHGILGSNSGLAPCVISARATDSNSNTIDGITQAQIRFNSGDHVRVVTTDGYWLWDGIEHTYKIECVGNYTINLYVDGNAVATNLKLKGTATGRGKWQRVLGVAKSYTDSSAIYKSDGGVYVKSLKLREIV